jgi:ABC-type sugar transport system ATPase subunit
VTQSAPAEDGPRIALSVRGLSKTFTGQRALDAVDLDLRAGEVHALLGENGSGKSTLIKCLAGYHAPDEGGSVTIGGEPVELPITPAQATRLGLVFVHQDLGLIPNLSVAENFAISQRYNTGIVSRIAWREVRKRAVEVLGRLNHADIDIDSPVSRLPVATQTIVAIARALSSAEAGARVLVLDEPTAALPDDEAERLFAAVRHIVASGVAVLYVSHKLQEILVLADRATVLRDGRKIDTVTCAGLRERDLVHLIVGREVEIPQRVARVASDEAVVEVTNLRGNRLKDVSFTVHKGEIVGLVGMLGSGRSELARMMFGAQRPTSGQVRMAGAAHELTSPRQAVRNGVALVPENRRRDGGVLDLPISINLTLPTVMSFFTGGRIATRRERAVVSSLISQFGVKPPVERRAFKFFSGGNQQKVVIAKWMHTSPKLVVFDEPVQGVDIGARVEIFDLIGKAAEGGTAVLLISSELDLMLSVCDRILVLRDGRMIADLPNQDLTRKELTELIYFGSREGPLAQQLQRSDA